MANYKEIVNIAHLINAFDCFYEMSDDPAVWDRGMTSKAAIKGLLEEFEEEDFVVLEMNLNDSGRASYERYFINGK